MRRLAIGLGAGVVLTGALFAAQQPTESIDSVTIAKIREAGLNKSQVMETMFWLTDRYGPRLVGSPDHWHALHAIAAMEAGADVYCQKPISRDVREGEAMVDAARKHKRVVQIGTQRKSTPHLIDAKTLLAGSKNASGILGVSCHELNE